MPELEQLSDSPRLLTLQQVAKMTGFHPQTIKRWTQQGAFPVLRIRAKKGARPSLRFRPASVEEWIRQYEAGAK